MAKVKKRTPRAEATKKVQWEIPFSKQNVIIAAIGLAVILVGYALMATGITDQPAVPDGKWNNFMAVTAAPFLLVIGYCIIIPIAIMKRFDKNTNVEQAAGN